MDATAILIVVIIVIAVLWALGARKLGDRARPVKKGDWPLDGGNPG